MDLTITLSTRDDAALLELTGVLDFASVPYLRQVAFGLFDEGLHRISLDVSGLRLLDAASMRALLYLQRRAEEQGGDLHVAGATGSVLTALEVGGVAKQLDAYRELDWPERRRERRPIALADLHVAHRFWPAEVAELFVRLHALEPGRARTSLRRDIIELCLPAAERLAGRFAGIGEPNGDLTQVAALGLVKAVDGFDPSRGIEFATYATPTIVGELKRYFRDHSWSIRLPRRMQELRLAVNQGREELTQRLGRSPTTADLARHLGVDEEQVIEVVGAGSAYRPVSLDMPAGVGESDLTLRDTIGADDPELNLVEHRESLQLLLARLPEREQRILSLRYSGNMTQAEIAECIGMSQMHVSRLLRQSLDFLRRGLTT
jgi:RNA polymerase sigma-70 factor (sigma-B/F/G subfamily)